MNFLYLFIILDFKEYTLKTVTDPEILISGVDIVYHKYLYKNI